MAKIDRKNVPGFRYAQSGLQLLKHVGELLLQQALA